MEIPITKDIRKFKTKDIGNFSLKQVGVIALGFGIGFITYKLSSSIEAAIIPLGIIIILGFFKPYGMSCIQFIKTVGVEKTFPARLHKRNRFRLRLRQIRRIVRGRVHRLLQL